MGLMRQGLSPKSVRNIVSYVHQIFEFAIAIAASGSETDKNCKSGFTSPDLPVNWVGKSRVFVLTCALMVTLVGSLPVQAVATERTITVGDGSDAVLDFAAAGQLRAAIVSGNSGTRVVTSSDGGQSFTQLALIAGSGAPLRVAVDVDGTYWVVRRDISATSVVRVPPLGGQSVVASIADSTGIITGLAAAFGKRFVSINSSTPTRHTDVRELTAAGLVGGALTVIGPSVSWPTRGQVAVPDQRLVSDSRGLWLLSMHYAMTGRPVSLMAGPTAQPAAADYRPDFSGVSSEIRQLSSDGTPYIPLSNEVWAPVASTTQTVGVGIPTQTGLVLGNFDAALARTGSLPLLTDARPLPAASGTPPATSIGLFAVANEIRSQQGLPILANDPQISQVSASHAQYMTANGIGGHFEDPGLPGFTGVSPGDRCQAAGLRCGGEIASVGPDAIGAAWGWWDTPLHRMIIGDPRQYTAGGGGDQISGKSWVMNEGRSGLLVAPVGLPRGTYRGGLSFSESTGGTPVCGYPGGLSGGLAVTAYPYANPGVGGLWSPVKLSLFDATDGTAVSGCDARWYYVPDDQLTAGHLYRATATYARMPAGTETNEFSWTFVPTGENGGASYEPSGDVPPAPSRSTTASASNPAASSRCVLKLSVPSRVRRSVLRKRGVTVKATVTACSSKRRIPVALTAKQGSRVILKRTVSLRTGRTSRITVTSRLARPGTTRLVITSTTTNAKAAARRFRVVSR